MTHHLTDPDCPQSVRDQINGAAQHTSQAIEKAREIAAEYWRIKGYTALPADIEAGEADDSSSVQIALRALSVSASKREALEARDELLAYVLQDDIHNRLTPRIVDIACSAFMLGACGKNEEDGGKCDWFTDTKPVVMKRIAEIRAAIYSLDPFGRSLDERMSAALTAALAHLPAGSEAVKPVRWMRKAEVGWSYTAIERVAEIWAEQGNMVTPLFAAPPSTPPAANVQEDGLVYALRRIAEGNLGDAPWQANYQSIRKVAQDALSRSKQAPTVAVPDEDGELGQARLLLAKAYEDTGSWSSADLTVKGVFDDLPPMRAIVQALRARAEQREAPSGVVGGDVLTADANAWYSEAQKEEIQRQLLSDLMDTLERNGMCALERRVRSLATAPTSDGR